MIFYQRNLTVVFFILAGCASCRTTSPEGATLREDAPAPGQVILPAYQAPVGLKPQILQWVVINPTSPAAADGEFAWNVDLRSGMEIWCERLCSEFSLQSESVPTPGGVIQRFVAVNKPIQGNTSPGMLNLKKDLRGTVAETKHIVIENVGVKGNNVVVDEVISGDKKNFYAVPMKLSVAVAEGPLLGGFMDKTVVVKLAAGAEKPEVVQGAEPVKAFVMGTLIKAAPGDAQATDVFLATKIITPWDMF